MNVLNKKGFMFIETIVMCAILMIGLLVIYNSYTSAITRERERLEYNAIAEQYKLYYIKRYLIAEQDWTCKKKYDCYIDGRFTTETKVLEITKDELDDDAREIYFDKPKTENNIELDYTKIYVAKCEAIVEDYPDDIPDDLINYIKTLKKCTTNYRIVGEFYNEKTKKYSYAWVDYPLYTVEEENNE